MIRDCIQTIRQRNPSVLVVGDIMIDEYQRGTSNRVSPESPSLIVDYEETECRLGGAANSASNCVALGGSVAICGVVGADSYADHAEAMLAEARIKHNLLRSDSRQTTVKTRIVANGQQVLRLDRETRNDLSEVDTSWLIEKATALLPDYDILVLSDYAKGVLTSRVCGEIIEKAGSLGKRVVIDPKGNDFRKYAGAFLLTPNLQETYFFIGEHPSSSQSTLEEVIHRLRDGLSLETFVVTRGSEGVSVFEPEKRAYQMPARAKKVYDVTGAGDTFIGAVAVAIGAGLSLSDSVFFANEAAAIVVGKKGTATVSLQELTGLGD
ncbi:MAG: bifunctional heptose 7-phosphate kinase/heptose 1-phosphate adenyltransferase [Aureliella sp.]